MSAASGGVQSSGIVREAASIAAVLPQPATAALGKGAGAAPDRAGECCFCVGLGVPPTPTAVYTITRSSGTWHSHSLECLGKSMTRYHCRSENFNFTYTFFQKLMKNSLFSWASVLKNIKNDRIMSTQKFFILNTTRLDDFPLCLQINQYRVKLGWCHDMIFFFKAISGSFYVTFQNKK